MHVCIIGSDTVFCVCEMYALYKVRPIKSVFLRSMELVKRNVKNSE